MEGHVLAQAELVGTYQKEGPYDEAHAGNTETLRIDIMDAVNLDCRKTRLTSGWIILAPP